MRAMPRWEALKERYYDDGLRVIVVKVQDPANPGCATIGFEPDDFICDDSIESIYRSQKKFEPGAMEAVMSSSIGFLGAPCKCV